jgi:HAD superfamily phosphatase (TIGR01668 family)
MRPRWLEPDRTIPSPFDLDVSALLASGKRAILFDLDNTLEPGRPSRFSARTADFLRGLVDRGLRVGVLSNRRLVSEEARRGLRVDGVPVVFRAGKPRRRGFLHLLQKLDVRAGEAVFVGDRLWTDVLGARRAGITSIRTRFPRGQKKKEEGRP